MFCPKGKHTRCRINQKLSELGIERIGGTWKRPTPSNTRGFQPCPEYRGYLNGRTNVTPGSEDATDKETLLIYRILKYDTIRCTGVMILSQFSWQDYAYAAYILRTGSTINAPRNVFTCL